uniref:Salivary secreted protein n=1 Tax=Dracunculus medinensis TaxID=318479 RepID=A0A158Q578_DRAME
LIKKLFQTYSNYENLITVSDTARTCLSGANNKFSSKLCDTTGSGSTNFVCQKFTCAGGRSPFTLRTCANPLSKCLAGRKTCERSRGIPSCQECNSDDCNK